MAENEWMVECVTQFLRSPLWTVPMHNFIDDNCIFFGGSDSSAVETEGLSCDLFVLHKNFCLLIDGLITNFITELGVSPEDLLKTMQNSTHPDAAKFFEYLLALDDFASFKQIMIKRNLELEQQAMAALARAVVSGPGQDDAYTPTKQMSTTDEEPLSPLFSEDDSFKQAMLESLQDEMRRNGAQIDDVELKKALALSMAANDTRMAQERQEQEELMMALEISRKEAELAEARRSQMEQQADEGAKQHAHQEAVQKEQERQQHEARAAQNAQELAYKEQQALERQRQMEQETINRRLEVARRAAEDEKRAEQEKAQRMQSKPQLEEPVVIRRQDPPQAVAAPGRPFGLAPIGRPALPPMQSGGLSASTFGGFAKLGAIPTSNQPQAPAIPMEDKLANQPTFSQLIAHAQAEKGDGPVTQKPGPSAEEQAKFAAYMRAQRDKILKANKAQRAEEMSGFKEANGDQPVNESQKEGHQIDEAHAKLSIELARRMRAGLGAP